MDKIDPFTSQVLIDSSMKLIPIDCKELADGSDQQIDIDFDIESERSMSFFCKKADKRDPVCMGCELMRGKEISI